ncbi:hypothetical protein AFERRID_01540 [Acidithiobacillus ferridurans]|uniref:Uncharacterized protein n=1 Tax=Acidithiobacillus ferridurans TaxID=1232575 RepID=A0A2Z6IF54_ACIFI|nr:hypothetical protein AFERRID_01540 [Acidithiobacillus ferridurans]
MNESMDEPTPGKRSVLLQIAPEREIARAITGRHAQWSATGQMGDSLIRTMHLLRNLYRFCVSVP